MIGIPVCILTITDAKGVDFVISFSNIAPCLSYVPPAWAGLETPTRRKVDIWGHSDSWPGFKHLETVKL